CDAAEVAFERRGESAGGVAATALAEPVEIQFMQDHRVHRDELLALQPVDLEDRRRRPIETGEALADRVQAPDGAAVVVLVMAEEQPVREALQPMRLE